MSGPRRGWRERLGPGFYRAHRVTCPRTTDRRAGGRCECPFEAQVPGHTPGRTRSVMLPGPVGAARAERRRLMAAGRPSAPVPAPSIAAGTLNAFAASYFRARAPVLAANTIRNRDDDYRRRIALELGDLPLEALTREVVEEWLARLVAVAASRRMIVQTVATLRAILATAVAWGRLADNPARRLRLPRLDPSAPSAAERVVGREDLERLFAGAGGLRTETMLRACGEAGLRRAEVAGLRWDDLNLAARRLEVRRQVVQERLPGGGHRKTITGPKAGRARRVALSGPFAERLAAWWSESVLEGGAAADGYVWPGRDGEPMHDRSLARALERACDRAGLVKNPKPRPKGEAPRPLVSPHRLRHSAASVMLGGRVPLTVVAAQLGHADPAITARIYAHLVDDRDLDLAAAPFAAPRSVETMGETMGEIRPAD
jgi:integrase